MPTFGKWLDIETAPKDGTRILMWGEDGIDIGQWQDEQPEEREGGVIVDPGCPAGCASRNLVSPDVRSALGEACQRDRAIEAQQRQRAASWQVRQLREPSEQGAGSRASVVRFGSEESVALVQADQQIQELRNEI